MSAGDEVGALVVDIGSSTVKAGYAGEDCPRSVFPSFVGQLGDAEGDTKAEKLFGDDAVHHRRDGLEIRSPLKDGLVEDWELFEGLLDHAVQKSLGCDSSQHPLLLVEPSFNTPEKRAKMVEIAFEKLHAPAVFLSKSAVLSAFANGKPTALVLESGGGVSAAVPVVDGYALQKAIVRSSLTGSRLTEILKRLLKHGRHDIKPPFCYKKTELPGEEWNVKEVQHPNTTSSFWEYHVDEVVRNIKETDCKVYASGPFDPILNENIPAVQHQLPSEEIVKIHMERFELTEFMLNPSLLKRHADAGVLDLFSQQGDTGTTVDLPLSFDRMAVSAISKCEADVRKDLCNNFIVVRSKNRSFLAFYKLL
mmetsp:Transcript_2472/g.5132  ORF Transcript_2472/g.5132 Transcript_2472/m.5132 type:complete len:364 (-) Transcript_2472:42-1133(-)